LNRDKENIIYTAKDIEAYHAGALTAAQMHSMEKAAMDDPFLAEAMEGFEGTKGISWHNELEALRQQVKENNIPAKLVAFNNSGTRWWKAVAAILVIGFGAALTFYMSKGKEEAPAKEQIAQNFPAPPTVDSAASKMEVTPVLSSGKFNDTKPTAPALNPVISEPLAKNNLTIPGNAPVQKPDNGFVYRPSKKYSEDLAKTESNTRVVDEEKKNIAGNIVVPPSTANTNNAVIDLDTYNGRNMDGRQQQSKIIADENRKRSMQNQLQLNRSFIAQVVGPDNSPLPFANINIKNENFGTYADVRGNFRLVSTDSLVEVEVKSVGYLPRSYTLRSNQPQNRIVLTEDASALKQKTIVKDNNAGGMVSGKLSRRATLLKDSAVNVEPADGWDNYNTYITNNIEIPDDILKKETHGEMEISFDVKSNGAISNVKIGESGCTSCAEAAKRLIEQGPQWKIKKGKKASAKIKVKF